MTVHRGVTYYRPRGGLRRSGEWGGEVGVSPKGSERFVSKPTRSWLWPSSDGKGFEWRRTTSVRDWKLVDPRVVL